MKRTYSKVIHFSCVWFVILDILVWGQNEDFFSADCWILVGLSGNSQAPCDSAWLGAGRRNRGFFSPWISVEWLVPALCPHAERATVTKSVLEQDRRGEGNGWG